MVTCANTYRQFMSSGYRMDFALLEETFLQRLQQGRLQPFTSSLRALLVDEYQDTNPLQEEIYFSIIQQTGMRLLLSATTINPCTAFVGRQSSCSATSGHDSSSTCRNNLSRSCSTSLQTIAQRRP